MKKPLPIVTPDLALRHSTVQEHCEALRDAREAFFWWYMGMTPVPWNFSLPFQDGTGRWWYQVKPGLCWPVDFLEPAGLTGDTIPFSKKFMGYQQIVPERSANSKLVINVIEDLSSFGPESLTDKRANVRAALKLCSLEVMEKPDEKVFGECADLWRDFVGRTAWKKAVGKQYLSRTWSCLLGMPGVSIMLGRDLETGRVAGFLISKIIGDTAYVDTIASSTKLMKTKVNDALIYSFLIGAQKISQVKKAHYAILSYKVSLEKFKQSHGFKPVSYPAYTFFTPPLGMLMRRMKADSYNRMTGNIKIPA